MDSSQRLEGVFTFLELLLILASDNESSGTVITRAELNRPVYLAIRGGRYQLATFGTPDWRARQASPGMSG